MAKKKRGLKESLAKHSRFIIVGALFLILVVVLIVFMVKHKDDKNSGDSVEVAASSVDVPKDKYEIDAYPNVNALMKSYFDALLNGDADTVASLCNTLSDSERFRIEEKAKFYQNFDNFKVYTKKGYEDNSYLVLVYFEVLYTGTTAPAPSLASEYVCTNDAGSLYINRADLSEDEQAYLLELSAQSDVEKLVEDVKVEYNKALEKDDNLAQLIPTIDSEVNAAVKERLVEQQRIESEAAAEAEAAAQAEAKEASAQTVRATDIVNVRNSPSTDSEALGKAQAGDTFKRYEEMDNGWSKIDYNGKEAYIKSEYLEPVAEETPSEAAGTAEGGEASSIDTQNAAGRQPGSYVTIKENVNMRETPSETGNKIGVAQAGTKYELVEEKDGWCKIKADDKEVYVKADFVE